MTDSAERAPASEWQAEHRIDAIFRLLGSPPSRTMLRSSRAVFADRANWECGCTLDYNVDDVDGAFQWHGCIAHSEMAGASVLASGSVRS